MTISNEAFEAAKKVHNEALPYLTMHARLRVALEAAAPIIRAEALRDAAEEWERRSETFLETMQNMAASRGYGNDEIVRYGAYSAEAQTTAVRLRARAVAERCEG